jgi:hypothetical protein
MKLDDEIRMLADTILICACFWGAVLALVFLSGCTQHKVDVSSSSVDRVVDRIAALQPPVKCRMLDLMPVPGEVHLVIEGDKIDADAGGEQLLRGYVACRSLAAPGTTKP